MTAPVGAPGPGPGRVRPVVGDRGNAVDDVAKLDARYPIALFPVRVETRFDRANSQLLIRVYPDEILADAHEPSLTIAEQQDGTAYWAAVAGGTAEAEAWRQLLGRYQAPRAAWIVQATDPKAGAAAAVRQSTWKSAVVARVLPSHWVAIAYRGGAEVARAASVGIPDSVPLTIAPDSVATVDVSGHGLVLDAAVAWTLDFGLAIKNGMALTMPLSAADLAAGIDRLLVFGVNAALEPQQAAARVAALVDAQHYTRGVAFVRQGTPTNDSREAPSGYPPPDPNGTSSFGIERGASLATPEGDGVRWTTALGIASAAIAHVEGADRHEQAAAEAMNRSLWPATWGYFLDTMMAPEVASDVIDAAREHFVRWVRARGPLPAFRVGGVPYGILPVSSLARWQAVNGTGDFVTLLQRVRPIWMAAVPNAPRIGRSGDPDADLLELLGMDASARLLRLRQLLGEDAQHNLNDFLGVDWTSWANAQDAVARLVLNAIGHPEWNPRVLRTTFADTAAVFGGPFVEDPPLSESDVLAPNYAAWIQTASIDDLAAQRTPFPAPSALLYMLLRYAVLTESWREGRGILVAQGLATAADLSEPELHRIVAGTETRQTVWQRLAQPVPAVSGSLSLGAFLSPVSPGEPPRALPEPIVALRDAVGTLATLPTAELQRLTSETLDLAANRLDAWIGSLAAERLTAMREQMPAGVHVGAFAWVENLRPSIEPTVTLQDGRVARQSSGGYIHAPSMTHAAAAAVLRNGFLTHAQAGSDTPYAVDLSSARVRAARFVLDSVQQGQSVGAVFGYRVERGLHERQVEVLIDPLRQLYPLVANKTFDSGEQAESIAARNVVDGLQLRTAWRSGTIPWGQQGLPASGAQRTALEAELGALDDAVDGTADLLLAESVFQIVRGSTMAASAGLDALAQGVRPPDPDIARGLRGGIDLTHRVALVLGGDALALGAGWPAAATVRAAAEPRIDGWLATLFGDPRQVRCRVRVPVPTAEDPNAVDERIVTLADLGVRPTDVLALSTSVNDATAAAELDRRVVFAAIGDTAPAGPVTVEYEAAPGWDRATVHTFPEVLEIAQAAGQVVGGATPLAPEDMVRAQDAGRASTAVWNAAEAEGRATAAADALTAARTPLANAIAAVPAGAAPDDPQAAALRTALRVITNFGVDAAFPSVVGALNQGGVAEGLLDQATSVLAEVDRRLSAADGSKAAPGADAATRVAAASAITRAIFGRGFVFIGGFTPAPGNSLAEALAASGALVGDEHLPRRWLQQVSRTRAPLSRWRLLRVLADGLAQVAAAAPLAIVQLPYVAGARWGALPILSDADRVPGRLSLALLQLGSPAADAVWYGLRLDEWGETIPNPTELTGLTFQYDDPGAEAPQAVLLAVPPRAGERWDQQTLIDILLETFDLAQMRTVDSRLLGLLGQLLPAIYLATNARNDTITATFDHLMQDRQFVSA